MQPSRHLTEVGPARRQSGRRRRRREEQGSRVPSSRASGGASVSRAARLCIGRGRRFCSGERPPPCRLGRELRCNCHCRPRHLARRGSVHGNESGDERQGPDASSTRARCRPWARARACTHACMDACGRAPAPDEAETTRALLRGRSGGAQSRRRRLGAAWRAKHCSGLRRRSRTCNADLTVIPRES